MTRWITDAACAGRGAEMTDATTAAEIAVAVAVCRPCPVRDECLTAHAAQDGAPRKADLHGIVAGGLAGDDLVAELRRRRARRRTAGRVTSEVMG